MKQLAPAAVVLATGLAAARDPRRRHHDVVIRTASLRRGRRAPAHVEYLESRIRPRFAPGAVHPRQRRGVREMVHGLVVLAKPVPTLNIMYFSQLRTVD